MPTYNVTMKFLKGDITGNRHIEAENPEEAEKKVKELITDEEIEIIGCEEVNGVE